MKRQVLSFALALLSVMGMLSLPGCASLYGKPMTMISALTDTPSGEETASQYAKEKEAATGTNAEETGSTEEPHSELLPESISDPETAKKMNSLSMLNYLVVVSKEINESSNSRIFLEKAFSELQSNINPNAIDSRTQTEMNYLFDTIQTYRIINEKRKRLELIYEQERAQAIHKLAGDPLYLLAVDRKGSIGGLVISVVSMAADAYRNYKYDTDQKDLKYLKDGWELDDEEKEAIYDLEIGTFNYMVDTCRDNNLPGELALSKEAVSNFVEWSAKENNTRKIAFFESNEKIYRAYGPYWLTLAECYYNNSDFDKCLKCFKQYENLQIRIFKQDHMLASKMPYAIDAAANVYSEKEYVAYAAHCASIIKEQTADEEWALRYFAAQTYVDLAFRTGDAAYLKEAYSIVKDNVNNLLDEQKAMNIEYESDLKKISTPKNATDAQKKDVENYNNMIKELKSERKTELPPISEPLLINCDLLFALAGKIGISDSEKAAIDKMLHEEGEAVFLVEPIDALFWFDNPDPQDSTNLISFKADELIVPVSLVSKGSDISVTVINGNEETEFGKWHVSEVNRKSNYPYLVSYRNDSAKKFDFRDGMRIHIKIHTMGKPETGSIEMDFLAKQGKKLIIFNDIVFEKVG